MMDGRDLQHLDLIMRHQSMGLNLCDSEEALGSSESEPAKPARPRGKRSRAAEVHNLSEKRRRSRINEKMKSLQSLIPNSSKTDKASMLDDAIEYLKQLQLQVQMIFQDDVMLKRCLSSAQETTSVPARDVVSQPSQEEALDQAQDQEIEEYEIIEVENPQACITATLSRSEGRIKVTLQSEKLTAGLF